MMDVGCVKMSREEPFFIVKVLEAEEPWDLMELKVPGSWKATRKQKALRENKDTTDRGLHHEPTMVSAA